LGVVRWEWEWEWEFARCAEGDWWWWGLGIYMLERRGIDGMMDNIESSGDDHSSYINDWVRGRISDCEFCWYMALKYNAVN